MSARFARILFAGLLASLLGATILACGWQDPLTPQITAHPGPTAVPPATLAPAGGPTDPTPVPVPDTPGPTQDPGPVPPQAGTTDTPWGRIVDVVPADWPAYPGAEPVEPDEGPASGAWLAPDEVDPVARWYRDTLEDMGFTIDALSSPLEDGTRVLDIVTDLPECRIQVTFQPRNGSTMVLVLYGAGCAGGDA